MAHGHEFSAKMVILKTSEGYLSKIGFTHDVTSEDILVVRAWELGGKWTPKNSRIQRFKEYFNLCIDIDINDCEFFTYNYSDIWRSQLSKWY